MTSNTSPHDRTSEIIRQNLSRIKLITVAGPLLFETAPRARVLRLLANRQEWGIERPWLMLAVHNDREEEAAEQFRDGPARDLARFTIVRQDGHDKTLGNAIEIFQERFDSSADPFTAKRHILCLTRRGGKGTPRFVSPFVKGQGTTCGEWTCPMVRKRDGTVIKGFMKAAVATGFCPVECPYCYLNTIYTDSMNVALNLEDLAAELQRKYRSFKHPINFGETGGLVEYDEWFSDPDGDGSIVQFVIDACAAARVRPFFLTKVRYPHYLRFHGDVQVGISLMPEPVREWLAPHGSPTDELLDSFARAVAAGARDPVVRMTTIWQHRDAYQPLLTRCRDLLGRGGWRITADILRFTPGTASAIAKRYPQVASLFAAELDPEGGATLQDLGRQSKQSKEHVKKIRPPVERQHAIFRWLRAELDRLGCADVQLTACKAGPDELLDLVRDKTIRAMPCACYAQ